MMRVNENGGTLLGEACTYENLNVIRYAIDEKNAVYDGNELLDIAVSHGHLDIVKYLVEEKGVDVNFVDKNGWSLLLHGTEQWRTEVVKYLLEKGANVNSTTKDGTTALHIAASQHNCEIIEYLILKGADINVNDGNIPLHLAAQDDIFQNQEDKIDVMLQLTQM
ncbi:MAG: ankyrin repeat domain-containing protein [Wolbachia endosymbiont of Fragariocoptes setiger]|nr:ankyrin repeat domain-containing protein [Wolbachia endosymbiont of Fragariocoptes setiger]